MRTSTLCACTALLVGLMTLAPAHSATLEEGVFACVTKEAWKELVQHIIRKDERGADYLRKQNLCIITKPGIEVSILESRWGTAKVRAYAGDASVVLWTDTKSIKE
jgi:hypothetical protein